MCALIHTRLCTALPLILIQVGYVWNFVGAIGGTLILYVFPPLFLLRLRYFAKLKLSAQSGVSMWTLHMSCSLWKDLVAMGIILLGVFVLVAGNYVAVEAIVKQNHAARGSCVQFNCLLADNNTHY